MRILTFAALIAFMLSAPFAVHAQYTFQPTHDQKIDTVAATTAWDSTYLGQGWAIQKRYVEVKNLSSGTILLVAFENDTTAGKILYLRGGTNKLWDKGILNRKWIRTKAATSTVLRYIIIDY